MLQFNKIKEGRLCPSLFLVFVIVFAYSCRENEVQNLVQNQTIPVDLDNSIESNLSSAFSSIEYILLEDSDDFPLIRPVKVLMTDDMIGVEDRGGEKYNFYNSNGEILFGIQSGGDGPGEFVRTEDFQIFSDSIVVKDPYLGKMLTFDSKGVFLREERLNIMQGNFFRRESGTLFYTKNSFDLGDFHFVLKTGNDYQGKVPADPRLGGKVDSGKDGFILDKYRNHVIFNIPFETKTVIFNAENQIEKVINFDFGRYNASREDFFNLDIVEFDRKAKEQNWVPEISSFYPIEEGYFLRISKGAKEFHEIFFDSDFQIKAQYKGYKNDIDFMPIRNSPWFSNDNSIGYLIPSYLFLIDYEKKFDGSELMDKRGNIHSFVAENFDDLKKDTYVLVLLEVNSNMY